MLKKRIVTYLLVALMIGASSVGYAAECNRGYRITYNPGNYELNQDKQWNTFIYSYNPSTNVVTPVKAANPVEPTTPVEPTQPTTPDTAVEATKPVTPAPAPAPAPAPVEDYSGLSQDEAEVVRLVNIERQKAGLAPLKASSQLSDVARMKSKDMAENNYFSHTSPIYGSPFDMMKQFGISYRTAGENIAKGYLSPSSVMNGWMNSSGHRANILNASFGTIGVGAYQVGGTIYWTQMFTN
ncbi:hypothetical protein E9840_02375 [Tissierella creatinini]|nr:hypothetical protein E9840_02375 [Tissierella creatinini]TJX63927.1 hypothetical protein E8P77_13785 [Soehngenia saccharolytica]